jgi:hypothetical protein
MPEPTADLVWDVPPLVWIDPPRLRSVTLEHAMREAPAAPEAPRPRRGLTLALAAALVAASMAACLAFAFTLTRPTGPIVPAEVAPPTGPVIRLSPLPAVEPPGPVRPAPDLPALDSPGAIFAI